MTKTVRILMRSAMWQYLAITLGFVVATVGGVAVLGSDNLFGTYLVSNSLLCLMFYLMSGIMLGSVWTNLCLSMGTTRRQYFLGMEATMLLGLAAYLAFMAVVAAAWPHLAAMGKVEPDLAFLMLRFTDPASSLQALGILAVFGQFGVLLGMLSMRVGRVGYIVSLVVLIFLCIGLYLAVGFGQAGMFTMPWILRPGPLGGICCVLALAAGAANGLLLRRFSV